jgi:hypothetical protein
MNAKTNQTCVLIAGMHRSGTSVLSRVLGYLGCTLPKNLLPTSETNQTGYWESLIVNQLNDEILDSAGSGWDDWAACTPNWFGSPLADRLAVKAHEVYLNEFGDSRLTVLKDPRLCRLLPFWLPVLKEAKIKVFTIIPIRNPKEVAASLGHRDNSDQYYNQLLWLRHVLDAEIGSRGTKRAFVLYDDLLENHSSLIATLEDRLGMKWPRRSARVSEEIDSFISTRYRNQKSSAQAVLDDPNVSAWLRDCFEIMIRWSKQGEDKSDYLKLDQIRQEFDQASDTFGRLIYRGKMAMVQLSAVKSAETEKVVVLSSLQSELLAKSEELGLVQAQLVAVQTQHEAAKAEWELRINELKHQHDAERSSDNDAATNNLAASEARINELIIMTQAKDEASANNLAEANARINELMILAQAKDEATARTLAETEARYNELMLSAEVSNSNLVKGLTETFALAEHDNEVLQTKLKEAELALEALEQARRNQMFEMNHLKSTLAQKKAETDDYHFQIVRFDSERAQLNMTIRTLKENISTLQNNGSRLAAQIEQIVTSLDEGGKWSVVPKRFKRARNRKALNNANVVNAEWYLQQNPDVGTLSLDPTLHYVSHGAREGRSPNPEHQALRGDQTSI